MFENVRNNGTSYWSILFYLIGVTLYVNNENIPGKKSNSMIPYRSCTFFLCEMVNFDD